MSSLCRASLLAFAAFVFAMPAAARSLTVCAEPDNLPFSHQDGRGFEIEVAALLAADLGRTLEVRYVGQRVHGFLRVTINAGQCDAIMSVPPGFKRLATTRSWYRSRYVAVSKPGAAVDLASFEDSRLKDLRIGIAGPATPPAMILARHGLADRVRSFSMFEPAAPLDATSRGEIDVALLWGPFAGWVIAKHELPLSISALPDGEDGIPLAFEMSIGVRKDDDDDGLRAELDGALSRNATAIAGILRRWHVPQL